MTASDSPRSRRTVQYALRLPREVSDQLRDLAADERRSINQVIVLLIEEGLARVSEDKKKMEKMGIEPVSVGPRVSLAEHSTP